MVRLLILLFTVIVQHCIFEKKLSGFKKNYCINSKKQENTRLHVGIVSKVILQMLTVSSWLCLVGTWARILYTQIVNSNTY